LMVEGDQWNQASLWRWSEQLGVRGAQ
jgi:hypothetical protein